MMHRFHLPAPYAPGAKLMLVGTESHHLAHVLRLKVGETVTLFDGQGQEATAEILANGKRETLLQLLMVQQVPPPTEVPIMLALAPPKGDRFRWAIEKATELGIARIVPLRTERGVVDPRETKIEKLRATIIAACKQCRRAHLTELEEPVPLTELLARTECPPLLLDPRGSRMWEMFPAAPPAEVVLLVGPEGGFSEGEQTLIASHGGISVSLGRTILRTETAAVAAAALAVHRYGGDVP